MWKSILIFFLLNFVQNAQRALYIGALFYLCCLVSQEALQGQNKRKLAHIHAACMSVPSLLVVTT